VKARNGKKKFMGVNSVISGVLGKRHFPVGAGHDGGQKHLNRETRGPGKNLEGTFPKESWPKF